MLGRLRMSVPQCIEAYKHFASDIFEMNGKFAKGIKESSTGYAYGADTFESAVKAIVKQYGDGKDTMIPQSPDQHCKVYALYRVILQRF